MKTSIIEIENWVGFKPLGDPFLQLIEISEIRQSSSQDSRCNLAVGYYNEKYFGTSVCYFSWTPKTETQNKIKRAVGDPYICSLEEILGMHKRETPSLSFETFFSSISVNDLKQIIKIVVDNEPDALKTAN